MGKPFEEEAKVAIISACVTGAVTVTAPGSGVAVVAFTTVETVGALDEIAPLIRRIKAIMLPAETVEESVAASLPFRNL